MTVSILLVLVVAFNMKMENQKPAHGALFTEDCIQRIHSPKVARSGKVSPIRKTKRRITKSMELKGHRQRAFKAASANPEVVLVLKPAAVELQHVRVDSGHEEPTCVHEKVNGEPENVIESVPVVLGGMNSNGEIFEAQGQPVELDNGAVDLQDVALQAASVASNGAHNAGLQPLVEKKRRIQVAIKTFKSLFGSITGKGDMTKCAAAVVAFDTRVPDPSAHQSAHDTSPHGLGTKMGNAVSVEADVPRQSKWSTCNGIRNTIKRVFGTGKHKKPENTIVTRGSSEVARPALHNAQGIPLPQPTQPTQSTSNTAHEHSIEADNGFSAEDIDLMLFSALDPHSAKLPQSRHELPFELALRTSSHQLPAAVIDEQYDFSSIGIVVYTFQAIRVLRDRTSIMGVVGNSANGRIWAQLFDRQTGARLVPDPFHEFFAHVPHAHPGDLLCGLASWLHARFGGQPLVKPVTMVKIGHNVLLGRQESVFSDPEDMLASVWADVVTPAEDELEVDDCLYRWQVVRTILHHMRQLYAPNSGTDHVLAYVCNVFLCQQYCGGPNQAADHGITGIQLDLYVNIAWGGMRVWKDILTAYAMPALGRDWVAFEWEACVDES